MCVLYVLVMCGNDVFLYVLLFMLCEVVLKCASYVFKMCCVEIDDNDNNGSRERNNNN